MSEYFTKVKDYLQEIGYSLSSENTDDELVVVNDEKNGIKNLIVDCEDPILILEQFILELKKDDVDIFRKLLQMNRNIIHGAFVLDETAKKVIYRDTLQLRSLDLNELEASINSLSLALVENTDELISFAK
ncbi:YbjN domain-containing protein [Bacteriovoracaceae bacterium]|nr:YbjN domain-containing protein [Bacteriovoracaceae bacterium]